MGDLLRAEGYKLTRGRSLFWVLGGLFLVMALMAAIPYGTVSWDGRPLTFSDGFVGGVAESTVPMIACVVYLALSVGGDFGSGALTQYVAAGHSRTSVVLARFLSYLAGFLILCLLYPFLKGLPLLLLHGWGAPFAEWGSGVPLWPYVGRTLLLQLPFYVSMAALTYLGAVAARSPLGGALAPAGIYTAAMLLYHNDSGIVPGLQRLIPLYGWEFTAMPELNLEDWAVWAAAALVVALLSLAGSWLLFRRAELK